MKRILLTVVATASLFCLPIASFQPDSALQLRIVSDAEAIIGMPWTPLSFAGVARRTMYRQAVFNAAAANAAAANAAAANYAAANAAAAQAAAANAAAAQAAAANAAAAAAAAQKAAAALPVGSTVPYLPPNCSSTVINNTNYFNCAGVYYKAGFQGNHIVYIVSVP
jgi:nucleotide-binding universal stress UspA family protein